ncbi:hypothetical protein [Brevundimonas sp.]|uniref:hypothetical protein n=1 Tax=Brevundimonas sp. TaxID=1871086 RepID=UPI002737BD8B|nr:hypothetical protein [Brevundimonas sp.]MDP3801318.1 hypothetical protein [Brevundimonas sp.]
MRRVLIIILSPVLLSAGCASLPTTDELCRDSSRCTPDCGSVARGGSPECDPYQREGHTRG